MEYIYAALTIHKAGGTVDEKTVTKVLEAAGAKPDDARVKALVAALDGVDIDDAASKAAAAPAVAAATAPSAGSEAPAEQKADEKEDEDDGKAEEEAAAGMGALFG